MHIVRIEGNSAVSVVEAPEPVPGPGQVVVRTAVSALCGSELKGYRGTGQGEGNSGHEGAGTVVAVGPDVERPQVGDRVGVSAVAGCGHCSYCAQGQYTWCRERRIYSGMHAELFLAAANACHVLPDDVPWRVGVLLAGDGLGVAFHTSAKTGQRTVHNAAVFGMGPIGLGHALLQSYLGRHVIAIDLVPYRLQLARRLGAAETIDLAATGDALAAIRDLTGGEGADVCFEAAGRPQSLQLCLGAVRTGGLVLVNGEQPRVELSPSEDLIRRDITVTGAWFYHFSEFASMLALYRQGLRVADLITHTFPLAEAAAAFREFAAGRTGKVLLEGHC